MPRAIRTVHLDNGLGSSICWKKTAICGDRAEIAQEPSEVTCSYCIKRHDLAVNGHKCPRCGARSVGAAEPFRSGMCAPCHRQKTKDWFSAHPDFEKTWRKDYHRKKHRLRNYGITPERYAEMLRQQGMVCAICRKPETARGKTGETYQLAVDHDHTTGAVRGLLCRGCNTTLYKFEADPSIGAKMLAYLEGHRVRGENGGNRVPVIGGG